MTSSMTAFSRRQLDQDWGSLTWELRSVNHRYLEIGVRLPDNLRGLENAVRGRLRSRLQRGKVDCRLWYQKPRLQRSDQLVDGDLVERLIAAAGEIQQRTGHREALDTMTLLQWPGVIRDQILDDDSLERESLTLFDEVLDDLVAHRQREGAALAGFLLQRVESIEEIVAACRKQMPELLDAQRQTLLDRLAQIEVEMDPARLEQEVALLAQKADVDEELDRLQAHLQEVERVVRADRQKGRRLDFLMQELNREANTLSSKAVNPATTRAAVELKVVIEQMREQIQNIE